MIHIITDSTCDISPQQQKELGIEILPLTVHFQQESFLDGVELSPAAFYQKLSQATELPTTSQISPGVFTEVFQKYINQGDQVVGIFISSHLSGTFQSAVMAKEMVGSEEIYLVDSLNATLGLALLVLQAADLRQQGKSAPEIFAELTAIVPKVRLLAAVDTLKYLKMGGRLSTITAVMGGILGISPVIAIIDGKVEAIGKAKGRKAAFQLMANRIKELPADNRYPISFGHSDAPQGLSEAQAFFQDVAVGNGRTIAVNIGAIVGTHVGPGAVGVAYVAQDV